MIHLYMPLLAIVVALHLRFSDASFKTENGVSWIETLTVSLLIFHAKKICIQKIYPTWGNHHTNAVNWIRRKKIWISYFT